MDPIQLTPIPPVKKSALSLLKPTWQKLAIWTLIGALAVWSNNSFNVFGGGFFQDFVVAPIEIALVYPTFVASLIVDNFSNLDKSFFFTFYIFGGIYYYSLAILISGIINFFEVKVPKWIYIIVFLIFAAIIIKMPIN